MGQSDVTPQARPGLRRKATRPRSRKATPTRTGDAAREKSDPRSDLSESDRHLAPDAEPDTRHPSRERRAPLDQPLLLPELVECLEDLRGLCPGGVVGVHVNQAHNPVRVENQRARHRQRRSSVGVDGLELESELALGTKRFLRWRSDDPGAVRKPIAGV